MKNATADAAEVHALTVAEIGRLKSEYARQRQTATQRRAALYASRNPEAPDEQLTDDVRETRELAKTILNGWSPPWFSTPPTLSEDQQLKREIGALDLVLHALDGQEIVARASASAAWAIEHEAEWMETCREALLAAERLLALEQKLRRMRLELAGTVPASLPGATAFGTGRSILSTGGADPISSARTKAIEDKIVTHQQIEDARHV